MQNRASPRRDPPTPHQLSVFSLWLALFIITALGAGVGFAIGEAVPEIVFSWIEGMAAGAMLTTIASTKRFTWEARGPGHPRRDRLQVLGIRAYQDRVDVGVGDDR